MTIEDEIRLLFDKNGLGTCVVCGVPFRRRREGQKTCGSKECITTLHRKNDKEKYHRDMKNDPERCREKHRAAAARYRKKKRKKEEWIGRMREILESDSRQEEINGDFEYGQKQVAKTLANVPKIDTSLERRHNQ